LLRVWISQWRGLEPFITSPEEFGALIRRDYERFGKLIKKVGIKAD
jgi:tripartite-type tricarboxylate transporter receptor subunit TctC